MRERTLVKPPRLSVDTRPVNTATVAPPSPAGDRHGVGVRHGAGGLELQVRRLQLLQ